VIEPAIAEVNQIADFVASYRIETGPRNKVVAVELWFLPKDPAGRNAAATELNRSRVGRKARRLGQVETVRPLDLGWVDLIRPPTKSELRFARVARPTRFVIVGLSASNFCFDRHRAAARKSPTRSSRQREERKNR
jgi:hypothetical protein